jgi:hypothetical protein
VTVGKAGSGGAKPARRLLGAGTKAYDWLKQALGFYGTAVTVAQLVPAILALLAVFFTPTAWLSATLRRWVGLGALAGAVTGMALLARAAGPRALLGRGRRLRVARLSGLAWWGLGLGALAAAAFRLHLAVVDVAFVSSAPFLTPLLDFYLGGGRGAATLYNALAAALAGAALAGLVAGAPAALLRRREHRRARKELMEEGGALAALKKALDSLAAAKAAVEAARAQVDELAVELADLRAAAGLEPPAAGRAAPPAEASPSAGSAVAGPDARDGRPPAGSDAPPADEEPSTSAAGRPGRRAPRAAAGRAHR